MVKYFIARIFVNINKNNNSINTLTFNVKTGTFILECTMDFKSGIKEINAIIAEKARPPAGILSTQQELAHLIKRLEQARKAYQADLKSFFDQDEYFDYVLWEQKNKSRDLWLDAAEAISLLKISSDSTS